MYNLKNSWSLIISIFVFVILLASCKNGKSFNPDSKYQISQEIRSQLKSIDQMMDQGFYDSAQIHLNLLKENNPLKQSSLLAYILTSRQTEIYYYNNLHGIGIQEAKKALGIAKELNDSSLLLDAYNFCGLFYTNMDSMNLAFQNFYKGLNYSSSQEHKSIEGILLSRPFHIYGNLAEAYYNENQIDSSIYYNKLTQRAAIKDENKRGEIISLIQLGDSYLKKEMLDSATFYFEQALIFSKESRFFDLILNSLGCLAEIESYKKSSQLTHQLLDEGFELQKNQTQINAYFKILFLNKAAKIYDQQEDFKHLAKTLELLTDEQSKTKDIANKQYLNVFMTGLQNESKLLNLEVEKAIQAKKLANNRLYIILLAILVLVALFISYRYSVQQKLKMSELRNKISQDLHDEIGSTLSGIAMYSYVIKNQIQSGNAQSVNDSLQIIEKNATEMVKKLSDIVWSVNPLYDNLGQLYMRLYEFTIELAQVNDIHVHSTITPELEKVKLSMIQRKNLYLICKEAINNAVKHSSCKNIYFLLSKNQSHLNISIKDDGKGLDEKKLTKGNGLINMEYRADEMKAEMSRSSDENGVKIQISFKIT
jgi:signal transduction histidine kinase